MADDIESLKTEFPEKTSWRFGRFTLNDVFFTSFMVGVFILANHEIGHKGFIITVVAWAVLIAPHTLERIYRMLWNKATRRFRNKKIWELGEEIPIPLDIHGFDEFGFLHYNGREATDSIIVAGEGSDLPSRELSGQKDGHLDLAELMRKAAAMGENRGYTIRLGYAFRTRHLNMPNLFKMLEEYLNQNVLHPAALEEEKPEEDWTSDDRRWMGFGKNMQEVLDVSEAYGREVTMAAVCTLRREELDTELTEESIRRLPVKQFASMITNELEGCGVIGPRVLSPRDLHEFMRGSWDISNITDYYEWLAESDDRTVLESNFHRPQEGIYDDGNGALVIDGSYHAILWLGPFPPKMYPDHLRQLYGIDVPYLSVAMVGMTVPYKGEYRINQRIISFTSDIDKTIGAENKSHKWLARESRIRKRQDKLYQSRYGMDYNILVAVHHVNREGLEDAVDTVMQQISLMNIGAYRIVEKEWLLPFLLSATTGTDLGML